jgi:hypothetical protein
LLSRIDGFAIPVVGEHAEGIPGSAHVEDIHDDRRLPGRGIATGKAGLHVIGPVHLPRTVYVVEDGIPVVDAVGILGGPGSQLPREGAGQAFKSLREGFPHEKEGKAARRRIYQEKEESLFHGITSQGAGQEILTFSKLPFRHDTAIDSHGKGVTCPFREQVFFMARRMRFR